MKHTKHSSTWKNKTNNKTDKYSRVLTMSDNQDGTEQGCFDSDCWTCIEDGVVSLRTKLFFSGVGRDEMAFGKSPVKTGQ